MSWSESIEHVSDIEKKIAISIPSTSVEQEVAKALSRYSSKAQLKGFRQGKAPKQIIEKMYGSQIRYEAVTGLVDRSFQETVKKNAFSVVGEPKVEFAPAEGEELSYTAQFFVYPRPEISKYESFAVTVKKQTPSEKEIGEVLERIRQSKAQVKPAEGRTTINAGDIIAGEVEIIVDGTPAERPEPLIVKLGTNAVPAALENALIGSPINEPIKVETVIPDDHREAALRGKPAVYQARVQTIYTEDLPELTDDFVVALGGDEKTVSELHASIEKRLNDEYAEAAQGDVDRAIVRELISRHPFEVPPLLITEEIINLGKKRGVIQADENATEKAETLKDTLGNEAEERVKAAVIIDALLEREKLHVSSEEVQEHMKALSERLGIAIKEVKSFFEKEGRMVELFVDQSRQKVLKFLRDRAEVTYT